MMEINESSVSGVINRTFGVSDKPLAEHIIIPDFQRPYCWKISDIQKILDDIDELRFSPQDGIYRKENEYYLGSVCFRYSEDKMSLEVLDGQQRLTSLMILIYVIGKLTKKTENPELLSLLECVEKKCCSSSAEDWKSVIQYNNPTSIRQIKSTIVELECRYRELEWDSGENKGNSGISFYEKSLRQDLLRLMYILDNGRFSVKIITTLSESEQFFQGENNRGLPLSMLEVLKAYHMRFETDKDNLKKMCFVWSKFYSEMPADGGELSADKEREAETRRRRRERIENIVIPALMLRFGVSPWEANDIRKADLLKGMMGTHRHDRFVDEKMIGKSRDMEQPCDLLDTFRPGYAFFKMIEQYAFLAEVVEKTAEKGFDPIKNMDFSWDQLLIHRLAMIAWADRFLKKGMLNQDSDGLAASLSEDPEFRSYSRTFARFLNRLRYRSNKNPGAFFRLSKSRLLWSLEYMKPQSNLILLPHRSTSPAACMRALLDYIDPKNFNRFLWKEDFRENYLKAIKVERELA